MKNWMRIACLAVGAGMAFVSSAESGKSAEGAAPAVAAPVRAGTVVDIKPNRIYLLDVTRAEGRLVAVGERGFTLVSDDSGKSWKAVGTPVVRSLTGVAFSGGKIGVAVGHGGSLVRTEDGGNTWVEVPLADAFGESLLGVAALGDGRFAAYGAFGMYFDSPDGGKSWTRRTILSEEFENHISQVLRVGDSLWLVGEYGTLARCEAECTAYVEVPSPYAGSFFGIVAAKDGALVLFGMRGSIYRSADAGATWTKVETGTTATFNGGEVLADGRIFLVGNAGLVATSTDNGQTFKVEWSPASKGFSAVAEADGGLVVVGEAGAGLLDTAALVSK
ncbi:MAG: YCF48-related protein [Steroidobacteraceae bacterium]|nr:YCF48-related protein [Steroidobacteraceae bacterium]